jgi:hypothetical protein
MDFNQESVDRMKEIGRMNGDELSKAEAEEFLRTFDQFFGLLHQIDQRIKKEDALVFDSKNDLAKTPSQE